MQVSYLPETHPIWDAAVELLKPAAEYGDIETHEPGDLIWVAFEKNMVFGSCCTRLLPGDEAEVRAISGTRMSEWLPQLDEAVSEWARQAGAWRLTARGRRGWLRYFRRFGWENAPETDDAGRFIFHKEL